MSLVNLKISMELLSDAIFSSGNSIPGGEDVSLRLDADGLPEIPGSTFKGLLRESLQNYLSWTGKQNPDPRGLFGEEGWNGGQNSPDLAGSAPAAPNAISRRIVFGDLKLSQGQTNWAGTRTFTALEDQIVKPKTLRMAACLRSGLLFQGELVCDFQDVKLIQNACAAIKWAGLLRHRGFGRVRVTAEETTTLRSQKPTAETTCVRYRLKLLTPMTISHYSRSSSDWSTLNYTNTKKYLPGSAVRGYVISVIAREQPEWFRVHKVQLLGDSVRFLNAFPVVDGQAAIPTPMGFYEDKGNTRFYSILTQEVEAEDKRAEIGAFVVMDSSLALEGYIPKTAVSLRMKRGQDREGKQVFTTNSIAAGTVLEGYIQLDDPALAPVLSAAFYDKAWLGADKYAGNGLCQVSDVGPADRLCGQQYSYAAGDMVPARLYMMLLSPASMTKNGDVIGLDEERLADLLEIPQDPNGKRLTIERCATSITELTGYNSTWGCATPSEILYEAGSVFLLSCSSAPSLRAIRRLEETGIGLRRSEGCGQVLFLKDYEAYQKAVKQKSEFQASKEAQLRQARCRWLLEHQIPSGLSKSQLGNIQVLCERAMALKGDCSGLAEFFEHNLTERGARHGTRFKPFRETFNGLMNTPLAETLGVEDCPDGPVERLRLICDWIDLSRKEMEQ